MISNPCKIGFLGSDEIAIPFLSHLAKKKEFSLEAVLTQPDRRAGRGRKLRPNPIKAWAVKNGCPVRDPEKPGPTEVIWFKELKIEILLAIFRSSWSFRLLPLSATNKPDLKKACSFSTVA